MNGTTRAVQRAWTVVRRGKPADALLLRSDWPVPQKLEKGEVLIKVQAAALNPVGWKMMRILPNMFAKRPHIAEHDFSGVIVDSNGTKFSNGDNVYGWIPSVIRQGALAEYIRLPADYFVLRPSNVTPVQAAGITLAAMTAYQGLIHVGKLESEQTVFVNGGSSAVGAFAIQIAKAKGARVVATASGKNEAFVRKMGADEFIDYTKVPLHKYLSQNVPSTKYHIIYDAVGLIDPSLYTHSAKYLAPNGIFITTGPMPKNLSGSEMWKLLRTIAAISIPSWLGNVNRRYSLTFAKNDVNDMKALQELVSSGAVKPIVDSVYEFDDVLKAYDRILSSRATGKIVVKVDATVD